MGWDDFKGIIHWEKGVARKLTPEEQAEFIERGFDLAKQWGAYVWGIGRRQAREDYREWEPFSTIEPVSGRFMGILPGHGLEFDETLRWNDDIDFCLQSLNKHRIVLRFNAYQAEGDGERPRRPLKEDRAEFKKLQEKWGSEIVYQTKEGAQVVRVPMEGV